MKTLRKEPIELVEIEYAPPDDELKPNILYYSEKCFCAIHLCLCGCGQKRIIDIDPETGWQITQKDKLTVIPSLLHMDGCKSHYIITNGIANFV